MTRRARRARCRGRGRRLLPGDGWLQRLGEGAPFGPIEALLAAVRGTVYARATGAGCRLWARDRAGRARRAPWSRPPPPPAEALEACSGRWSRSASGSRRCSRTRPTGSTRRRAPASTARSAASPGGARRCCLDRAARRGSAARPTRILSTGSRSIGSRAANMISACTATGSTRPRPLAEAVLKPAHGVLVTSATLRGGDDWTAAEARTGALHLPAPAERFEAESPFDYAATARSADRHRRQAGRLAALAGAYARLIEAAGGGTLGCSPRSSG